MNEKKKESLMDKPLIDLREMLEREDKILANKKFLDKLKDKGEKVKKFRNEIEKAIKVKESIEEASSFLAKLNLGNQIILPKHPMFSANDVKSTEQPINNEQNPQNKDVIKELLNEEIDIFSVALSRTFDPELCQKRSERFIPNKISSKIKVVREQPMIDDHKLKKDNLNEKLSEKYKDTALEPYLKDNKFVPLSIESSLELGKEQKVKDYEIEKIRIENRLEWRKIIEFDTDNSSETSDASDNDMDNET